MIGGADREWLNTKEVAALTGLDVSSITRDAQQDVLHGHQRTGPGGRPIPRSRWKFHPDAVDVFMKNGDLRAQKQACCAALHLVRRAG